MNPNPFASLNHFTFPVSAMSTTSSLSGQNPRERRADDRDQAREPHRRDPRPGHQKYNVGIRETPREPRHDLEKSVIEKEPKTEHPETARQRDPERRAAQRGHGADHDQGRDLARLLEPESRRGKGRKGGSPGPREVELLQRHDACRLDERHRDRVDRERDPTHASALRPAHGATGTAIASTASAGCSRIPTSARDAGRRSAWNRREISASRAAAIALPRDSSSAGCAPRSSPTERACPSSASRSRNELVRNSAIERERRGRGTEAWQSAPARPNREARPATLSPLAPTPP